MTVSPGRSGPAAAEKVPFRVAFAYWVRLGFARDGRIKARFIDQAGHSGVGSTPAAFGAYIKAEITKWAPVVKASGAKPE